MQRGSLPQRCGSSLAWSIATATNASRAWIGLARVLDEERLVFHLAHVVYGLSLGTWMSMRQHRGEVHD